MWAIVYSPPNLGLFSRWGVAKQQFSQIPTEKVKAEKWSFSGLFSANFTGFSGEASLPARRLRPVSVLAQPAARFWLAAVSF
jgi:hypothetical protein